MIVCSGGLLALLLLLNNIFCSDSASKYTDENRPYEFGFKIGGEQHRHEKKDENGIIMGEFGFITADGVYHVTVYATDENGNFHILSMKNIRVNDYKSAAVSQSSTTIAPVTPKALIVSQLSLAVPRSSKALSQITPFKVNPKVKTVRACSSCIVPLITKEPNIIDLTTAGPSLTLNTNQINQPNSNIPQAQLSPSYKTNDIINNENNKLRSPSPKLSQNTFRSDDNPYKKEQTFAENKGLQDGSLNYQSPNLNNKQKSNNYQQSNKYDKSTEKLATYPDIDDNSFAPDLSPPNFEISPQIATGQQLGQGGVEGLSKLPVDSKYIQNPPSKPILVSADMKRVPRPRNLELNGDKQVLPAGLTSKDMLRLLYKFNYTLGFHGHYEEGYANGDKKGYYFETGRDGVKTKVEYTADEQGYHPKIIRENLGLDSPDVPKPETEKDPKYGLKGYEFKWLYFPENK